MGEANTVCIAGMGGKLISDILSAEPEVLAGLSCLVLRISEGKENICVYH